MLLYKIKLKKSVFKRHTLNVPNFFILLERKIILTELITEQILHSEFDYSKNSVILTSNWIANYRIFRLFQFILFQQIIISIKA